MHHPASLAVMSNKVSCMGVAQCRETLHIAQLKEHIIVTKSVQCIVCNHCWRSLCIHNVIHNIEEKCAVPCLSMAVLRTSLNLSHSHASNLDPSYKIQQSVIKYVSSQRDLGITITSNLV